MHSKESIHETIVNAMAVSEKLSTIGGSNRKQTLHESRVAISFKPRQSRATTSVVANLDVEHDLYIAINGPVLSHSKSKHPKLSSARTMMLSTRDYKARVEKLAKEGPIRNVFFDISFSGLRQASTAVFHLIDLIEKETENQTPPIYVIV